MFKCRGDSCFTETLIFVWNSCRGMGDFTDVTDVSRLEKEQYEGNDRSLREEFWKNSFILQSIKY